MLGPLLLVLFMLFALLATWRLSRDLNRYGQLVRDMAQLYRELDGMEPDKSSLAVREHFHRIIRLLINIAGLTIVMYGVSFGILFKFAPDIMAQVGIVFYISVGLVATGLIFSFIVGFSARRACLRKIEELREDD